MVMKNKIKILVFGVLFIYLCFCLYNLLYTSKGAKTLVKLYLYEFAGIKNVAVGRITGNIAQGLKAEDIQLSGIKGINPSIVVKIHQASLFIPYFNPAHLVLKISNGKVDLFLGNSLIFAGSYADHMWVINLYTSSIDLRSVVGLFPNAGIFNNLSGIVEQPDIYITGSWLKNKISGKFIVRKAFFNRFILEDCPVNFKGVVERLNKEFSVKGEVGLREGNFYFKKTQITLQAGKIIYSGNPKEPSFDLKGDSLIGETKINIIYKGSFKKPDLRLTSDPDLPQQVLLIMLATSEPWKGMESSYQSGQLNPDLARDFLDYFLLGGSGSKLAKKLGISEVSFKYDAASQGIKATSPITDKIGVIYGVEQTKPSGENQAVTTQYDVGAKLKFTDSLSLTGETQINKQDAQTVPGEQPKPEDKVILKYEFKF